jgi:hypothetical protein
MVLTSTVHGQAYSSDAALPLVNAYDNADRAVIDNTGLAHTPIEVVTFTRVIDRLVALVALAEAALAGSFAAAVIVGDDIVLIISRVEAGANPGYGGHLGPWRTGVRGTTATAGYEAINGAVAPVVAVVDIALWRVGVGFAAGAWL